MAKRLIFDYTFDPANDRITVDGNVATRRILLITNITDNIVLFNFADPTKKIVNRVYDPATETTAFTLQYDCAAMSATDEIQVFIEEEATRFTPEDPLLDPVNKLRISQPNTLIDTDFEYGLQSSKWETLERVNEVPAFYAATGDSPLTNIIEITTAGTRLVTVSCSSSHGLATGTPLDVRGVDSSTAEGTFIVKRTSDLQFTFDAKAVQPGTPQNPVSIFTPYVSIVPGRFYVGSTIAADNTAANTNGPMTTDAQSNSTVTITTPYHHGFKVNSTFYLANTLPRYSQSFNPVTITSGGDVDDRSTLLGTLSTFTATISTTTLTVQASPTPTGFITVGQRIVGAGVTPGTFITALGTGTGGSGTYTISVSQTVGSATSMTGQGLGTGEIKVLEPFHEGVVRRDINNTAISVSTHYITIPDHGLATGDMIAYGGFANAGSAPQVAAVSTGRFTISAGQIPTWSTSNSGMLYAVVIDQNNIRVATNAKDAYDGTNLIQFTGSGSLTQTFSLFKRGTDFADKIVSIAATSGQSTYIVTLASGFTNNSLGILPKRQITIMNSIGNLQGVYVVQSANWSATGTTFVMAGPTNSSGVLINSGVSQTYTVVAPNASNTAANGTTSFVRNDPLITTAAFTATISTTTMTVSAITQGAIVVGEVIQGPGVTLGTTVTAQLTATNAASATPTASGNSGQANITVSSATGIVVGQFVTSVSGVPSNTFVTAISGTTVTLSNNLSVTISSQTVNFFTAGQAGTYTVSTSQTVSPAVTMTDARFRIVLHDQQWINHLRLSHHDWYSISALSFTRQNVLSDTIYIKNHGLSTAEPVTYVGGGNTYTSGVTPPAENTVYYIFVTNADEIQLRTTQTISGLGPYGSAAGATAVNFNTANTLVGGIYHLHPGFMVSNFTTAAAGASGTGRDRAIAMFQTAPGYLTEGSAVVLIPAGGGAALPTGITGSTTTYAAYQKYFVRSIILANTSTPVFEFSLSLTPNGTPIDFTGNATAGNGFFIARIEENQFSNSFFLVNHGGTSTNQAIGGTGQQGGYPSTLDYPGPLFDYISDVNNVRYTRVRVQLTAPTPAGGLTNTNNYYAVPINNNCFKVQDYAATQLPTGNNTVQITSITSSTTSHAFTTRFSQNITANRIVIPFENQNLIENANVRYENRGTSDIIAYNFTGVIPGLINNQQYLVRNVSNVYYTVTGVVNGRYTAAATQITVTSASGLSTGATIRIGTEDMTITNIATLVLTVTRAQNGTTAAIIQDQAIIERRYGTFQLYTTTQFIPRLVNGGAANTTTKMILLNNHGLRPGETLVFVSTATGAVTPGAGTIALTAGDLYYAIVEDENNFGVALTEALAYANFAINITTAGTAWVWLQYYAAAPLTGLNTSATTHRLVDCSATGAFDGGYTASAVTATTIQLPTGLNVPTRVLTFDPQFVLNQQNGEFYIQNHGFSTGTAVTYSRGTLTFAIGEGSGQPYSGYNALTNNTVYFVVRRNLNAFCLATTKANALAGTVIKNFSGPGSPAAAGVGHTFTTNQMWGESLAPGLATIIARDLTFNGSSSTVISASTDRINVTGHGLTTGDRVVYQVWANGGQVNGLVNGRTYFVSNTVFTGATAGGAASGQTANQFSLHNTWVGSFTNTDRVDISGVGRGAVHTLKVSNPTLVGNSYRGEWNAADGYRYGDIVLFRNAFYMSLTGIIGNLNTNNQPVVTSTGLYSTDWQPVMNLPAYQTKFLTTYRAGDTIKLSYTSLRRTLPFDASGAAVTIADNTITITNHRLNTGDAVIYRVDGFGTNFAGTGANHYFAGNTGNSLAATPVGGLTPNQVYYVGVQTANVFTLFNSYAEAFRGGSSDSGNFAYAVNLTATGTGTQHKFEILENNTLELNVVSITSDTEMVVSDPYTARAVTFNPAETTTTVAGLTYQIVNLANDEILIPNHGFLTGTKVVYTFGPLGSGSAIGGLTDGTAYFVIKVTDDLIKLATTEVNAVTGIPVDLTSIGSGITHYLIATTICASSLIRFAATGAVSANAIASRNFYTSQTDGNIRNGVLTAVNIMQDTQLLPRPDCANVHRPFDGGVEINASKSPGVSIVRQTRKYFRYQSGKGLQWSTGLNFSPSIDVSRITHDGTTYATVVTRRPHQLSALTNIIIENVGAQSEYEAVKCERDLGYFVDGVGFDITLGTNYNAVFLGLADFNSQEITTPVINNIQKTGQYISAYIINDATAITRNNAFWAEAVDILQNGRNAADAVTYTDPVGQTASRIAAKDKIVANRTFITAEINAWVALTYPNATHDVAKCTRDVLYVINAYAYDIVYGGNSASYDVSRFFNYYYTDGRTGTSTVHRAQTVAAYQRLKTILGQIVQGVTVTKTTTGSLPNTETQVTAGNNATSGDALIVQGFVDITISQVNAANQAAANVALAAFTRTAPSVAWAAAGLQTAKTQIDAAKAALIPNVVRGTPYTTPSVGEYFKVFDVVDDFTFRYVTNGIPANTTPAGFPNLFVYSWDDAKVRAGVFDDQNGMFYEYDGKVLYCVKRFSTKQLGGTLAVTRGSNTVTGNNTNFLAQLTPGQNIVIRGMSYKVTRVASNTSIDITPAYRGSTKNKVQATLTVDEKYAQYEWNIDKADGTGRYGFDLNINRMQMAYIDYSWYGAGKIRYGFKGTDGRVIYVHEIVNNNHQTEAYMRSGNLPARYEIKNGNAPTYAPSLYHWGASMIMDGVFEDDKAYLFSVASGSGGSDTISIPTSRAGTAVPVLSLRLAPSVDTSLTGAVGERDLINRMIIVLQSVGIVINYVTASKTTPASVRLVLNGSLSQQAYFAPYGTPSLTQIIKHTGQLADTITGGLTIYEFRCTGNNSTTQSLSELAEIGNSITGGDYVFPNGPDVITLCVVPTELTDPTLVTARITWTESQA